MYNDDEEKRNLPIKTFLVSLILIIIFVLLLVWLLPMPNLTGLNNRIFNANIQEMKNAAIPYFTTDKLPQKDGESVKLSLKEMENEKIILPFTDKNGDACDTDASYIELTKKISDEGYDLKTYLKCNGEDDYVVTALGCYSYCKNAVCEKETKSDEGNTSTTSSSSTSTTTTTIVSTTTQNSTPSSTTSSTQSVASSPAPTPSYGTPSCTLVVSNGTIGENGWYKSNVVIGFGSKSAGSNANITAYGIGTSTTYANNKTFTVSAEGITTVYGYVKASSGKTATCRIVVKKDTVSPDCKVAVLYGTQGSNGVYTSDVAIGFATKADATSEITAFGLTDSATQTFNGKKDYRISNNGTYKIYGYVKDGAGHVKSCDVTVKINKSNSQKSSIPSCELQVTNGVMSNNNWYTSDVIVGFKSKQTTGGATITSYGIGTGETYSNNNTYTISRDGSYTIYGYVKDSYGNKATCSIPIKRDATKPTCSLKVTSGSYSSSGYYSSDVTIGFNGKNDITSGINSFGIGKSTTYTNNTSYRISEVGKHTVYGYVKDNAGNTNTCSITIEKRNNLEYQYKKDIAAEYSAWSDWSKLTYNPSNKPSFGTYALIEMVDLGKNEEVDHYEYSTGDPIKQTVKVKVGTVKGTYCSDYNYYRVQTTTKTTTYAVSVKDDWSYVGRVTRTSPPTDTMTARYEYVGLDWSDCGTGCSRAPRQIWNKFTRTAYLASSTNTVTSSDGVVVKCASTSTRTITIYSNVEKTVGYEQIRRPVYKDVYYYKKRTRSLVSAAYVDYKWSYYNDQSLLNKGYAMTGNTRVVG